MLIAIDIGGTKITVARLGREGARLRVEDQWRHASGEVSDLAALVTNCTGGQKPTTVGIGVAGPVIGRRARLTNLAWEVDAAALERRWGCPVVLLNDLEAHAHGIAHVGDDQLVTLNAGRPRAGNRALIAAGTGLGEAQLFWNGATHVPSPSEGGHTDFGPGNEDEIELLRFLMRRYGHVSWERVVSGLDGFRNLYEFLSSSGRIQVPAEDVAHLETHRDLGAPISAAASAGKDYAKTVLRWFVKLYGAEAGNLALKAMAVDGLYVGGGIAPRILSDLKEGVFLAAFADKGRFRDLLLDMPVHVITDPHTALKGAAAAALAATD